MKINPKITLDSHEKYWKYKPFKVIFIFNFEMCQTPTYLHNT